jgi:hydrogenase maturation protease
VKEAILVACVGNIFLGDDGFGTEAARALAVAGLGRDVRIVDYGIRGLDLAYAMLEDWHAVVLVDAIRRGGPPGTLYLLRPGEQSDASGPALDPHSMDPASVLSMARSQGEVTAEVFIVGCEPLDFGDDLEGRIGLSEPMMAAVPETVVMVRELVERLRGNVLVGVPRSEYGEGSRNAEE